MPPSRVRQKQAGRDVVMDVGIHDIPVCKQANVSQIRMVLVLHNVVVVFAVKNLARFRKWLDLEPALDGHTPAHDVIEILGYLAYDTVREVTSMHHCAN